MLQNIKHMQNQKLEKRESNDKKFKPKSWG